MTAPSVLSSFDDRIGWITLNRPSSMNAITVELAEALAPALTELAERVDVIVIRGAGEHFSVGGDFKALETLRVQGPAAMARLFDAFGRACAVIGDLDIPVVASVHGCAMAGGFELMQAADLAIVAADAKLADNHSNFGQVPGGGGSQRLPRLVGLQRAAAHMLTGDRLSGTEAVAWGLAYRAVPAAELPAATLELATKLSGKAPDAQAKIKRLIRRGSELALADGLAREREVVVEHLSGAAAGAGIASFNRRGAR